MKNNAVSKSNSNTGKKILRRLEEEVKRIQAVINADKNDLAELQSEWQERDSPAERNIREVEWNQYSALKTELSEVAEAIERLEAGVYGICEDCGEKIGKKRIELLPAVRKCIECQALEEKELGIAGQANTL